MTSERTYTRDYAAENAELVARELVNEEQAQAYMKRIPTTVTADQKRQVIARLRNSHEANKEPGTGARVSVATQQRVADLIEQTL